MSDFMRTLCKIAIPVTLQGMLQASFSIVDQIMIGQLGEAGIAAVGLCSNFTLIFSVMSGAVGTVAGILIAQFLGAEEHTEAWRSLDVSLVCGGVLAALFLLTAGGFPAQVLGLYTADDAILRVGAGYFRIVAFSYLPMAVSTVLSAWLRCKEHAAVPFWASFGAVAANTGLNYLLIFGKLGAPTMGVTGAAIATLVSQLLNLLLILIGFAVCLQKEAERPLTVEIWTRWAGVLCLFSEYNGEPDLLFRLAQVERTAVGNGHAQLVQRAGGKLCYGLAVLVRDRPQRRLDLCQLAVCAVGVEGQRGGASGQVVHAEGDGGVGVDVFDCRGIAPACNSAFAAVLFKLCLRQHVPCSLVKIDLAVGHFGQINKAVLQAQQLQIAGRAVERVAAVAGVHSDCHVVVTVFIG